MQQSNKLKTKQEQLKKRLNKVNSEKELKKIIKVSSQQNKKLIADIKQLKDRVQTIMNSRKINTEESNNLQPKDQAQERLYQQLLVSKKELKVKYAKMKQLKQQINIKNSSKIDQAEHAKKNNLNVLADTDKNIVQLKKQLEDLKATNKKLQKTMENNKKLQNLNQPRIEQLQQQNKGLKIKISQIRKIDYEKQYESIKVQTTLIGHKTKFRQNQVLKSMISLKNLSNLDKNQMLQMQKIKGLKQQVNSLKRKFEIISQIQKNQQIQQKIRRKSLYEQNKQLVKKLKDDQLLKYKMEQQNNLWRKKWNDICRAIQNHNKKIKKISVEVQAKQYIDLKPLRKDYAGILNKNRFDDRLILKDNKHTKIIGMMIYQMEKGIVSIQAFYNNGQRTSLPIPHHFIQRCKVTKIECAEHDFFKLFKIKYNNIDNKITKVEIRSNKNIKYHYGQKKQWSDLIEGDTIYGFDIGIKQYPVCIFGSYNYFKGYWLLEGFGVQINQLQQ